MAALIVNDRPLADRLGQGSQGNGVIEPYHPGRGSRRHRRVVEQHGVVRSSSWAGNCWDAVADRFIARRTIDLVEVADWATRSAATTALFAFIDACYNRQLRLSPLPAGLS